MSYAVFKDRDRISRPFQTQGDAWDCANDAGLVENVPSGGGSVQLLDSHCVIKSCDHWIYDACQFGLIAALACWPSSDLKDASPRSPATAPMIRRKP
jgi:hypothetical protein